MAAGKVKPYLQLVRLPNLFTAAADALAGWLLVGGRLDGVRHWPLLVAASVCLYAGGVVLNDVFDVEVDRRERPGRPLPSGRVGVRFAAVSGSVLMALGVVSAWASAARFGVPVALGVVAFVLAYDAGFKKTLAGPEVMGACRGLNLLLGMSHAAHLGGPSAWLVAAGYAAFVTGITWISRSEVEPASEVNVGVAVGVLIQNLASLIYLAACVQPRIFPRGEGATLGGSVAGLLLLLALAVLVNRRTVLAVRCDRPEVVQRAVKAGIMALVWLHVGLLLAVRGPAEAAVVAALWVPAVVSGRWVYST